MNVQSVAAFLTLCLVAITAYYAWQTRRMVVEMRKAREMQVSPRLVLTLGPRVPGAASSGDYLYVENVGAGMALEVDIEVALEPSAPLKWRLQASSLASGERRKVERADVVGGEEDRGLRRETLALSYKGVRLLGTYRDVFGSLHQVDSELALREGWTVHPQRDA